MVLALPPKTKPAPRQYHPEVVAPKQPPPASRAKISWKPKDVDYNTLSREKRNQIKRQDMISKINGGAHDPNLLEVKEQRQLLQQHMTPAQKQHFIQLKDTSRNQNAIVRHMRYPSGNGLITHEAKLRQSQDKLALRSSATNYGQPQEFEFHGLYRHQTMQKSSAQGTSKMPHQFINVVSDYESDENRKQNKQIFRNGYIPPRESDFKMPKGKQGDFTEDIKTRVLRYDEIGGSIVKESVGTAKEPASAPGRNCVLDKITKLFKCTQPNVKQ